jgi:1,4-alpha-glucan branching enzyme
MSLKKTYSKDAKSCKVTFHLPLETAGGAKEAHLLGEFNDWNAENPKSKMTMGKDGSFSATLSLAIGRNYEFRYLLDGVRWENDPQADGYVHIASVASDNSVVSV